MSEASREIREICRSITLDNPKVVARLTREAELGTINPALLINLIDRGWGRPIPMGAEKPKTDPLIFLTTDGLLPWDERRDPGREKSARMIREKEAELALEAEARKTSVVIDTKADDQDAVDTLEVVRLPDPEPFVHPHVRERDRLPWGQS